MATVETAKCYYVRLSTGGRVGPIHDKKFADALAAELTPNSVLAKASTATQTKDQS